MHCFLYDMIILYYWGQEKGLSDNQMHFLLGCGPPDWEPDWIDDYYNPPGTITDMAATIANLELMVSWLRDGNPGQGIEALAPDDTLIVVTFDHGGHTGDGHGTLILADPDACWEWHVFQVLYDWEYAELFDQLNCYQVHLMQQCHAGRFIDDLQAPDRVIMTACSTEMAYTADDVILQNSVWDTIPGSENEIRGDSVSHGEFLLHVLGAMRGVNSHYGIDPAPWENPWVIADYDSNGQVFLDEIWQWEWEHDSRRYKDPRPSTPQFSDSGNWAHTFMVHDPVDAPENITAEQIETPAECATCHSGQFSNYITWDDRPSTENRTYFDLYCIQGTGCAACHAFRGGPVPIPWEKMTFEAVGEQEVLCPEMVPDGYSELFMPTYSYTSDCPDTSGQGGETHPL
jgi:hypothetical protein